MTNEEFSKRLDAGLASVDPPTEWWVKAILILLFIVGGLATWMVFFGHFPWLG